MKFCVFEQMQLSHDSCLLHLVSPVYATSGSLAIINLRTKAIKYVSGVNLVYVIETGSHRDELIYQRRMLRKSVAYPLIHARPDGRFIAEISNEDFPFEGRKDAPRLRQYLRKISGTITINDKELP